MARLIWIASVLILFFIYTFTSLHYMGWILALPAKQIDVSQFRHMFFSKVLFALLALYYPVYRLISSSSRNLLHQFILLIASCLFSISLVFSFSRASLFLDLRSIFSLLGWLFISHFVFVFLMEFGFGKHARGVKAPPN